MLFVLLLAPFAAAYGVTFYSPRMNPQYGKVYELVEPGEQYTVENTKDKDVAITKLTFTIDREAKNGGITIYHHLSAPPTDLPAVPENDTYELNELKYSGFVPHDTTSVVYEFRVAKSWLMNMSVPRNAIMLHFFNSKTDSWDELPTDMTSEDNDYVYFRAKGIGYHYLLIGKSQTGTEAASKLVETDVEKQDEPKKASTALESEFDVTSGITPTPAAPAQPAVAPAPSGPAKTVSEEDAEGSDSKLVGALILIAIAVIVLIIYLVFGKKKLSYSVDKELHNYIKESMNRGRSKEEVRQRLLDVGWHTDRVDKALTKYKSPEAPAEKPKPEPAPKKKPAAKKAKAKKK
jgi:PGF-pre-PGF domain-containing protein